MNELMSPKSDNAAATTEAEHWRECMSALVDGELSAAEVDELMAAMERDPELQAVWARYQAIGPLVVRANASLPSVSAANDPVFWRRLAVAASFVAVTTVIWGVWEQGGSSGVTLASGSPTVWVSSAAGPMMRDPVLEDLLQQHRELGDGGALQVSTGFLRSATLHSTP
jgi:ferric-dicitrate binding protein FerR (iron transport regulator)